MIKHRDDWTGPVDIAEFAPLSVKSGGNFADILSQDDPDIWRSQRPAQGGQTGALFDRIIAQALENRSGRSARSKTAVGSTKRKTAATKQDATRQGKRTR